MEEIVYNILWIDDEHEGLSGIKGRAKRNGIYLFPYKSLNGGMSELERNSHFYDGVLLDAKIFENEDDVKGSEDTYWVHRVKERLLQLKKNFEILVLTGQARVVESKDFTDAFPKVYKKGSDQDVEKLFNYIKEAASKQPDTQIRQSNKRVFDLCTEKYLGKFAGQDLLYLLKVEDDLNIENLFNSIRKVVEDLFIAFHKFNLLPIEFIKPNVALNQSSIFLAGKDKNEGLDQFFKQYKHLKETHLPTHIANQIRNILTVIQPGSHRSVIDSYVKTVRTPYLFKGVLYQLLDVLVWFKMYVDSNPKAENWIKIEDISVPKNNNDENFIIGRVIQVNTISGFAFFEPKDGVINSHISKELVAINNLVEGIEIMAKTEEYIYKKTGETRSKVTQIRKI